MVGRQRPSILMLSGMMDKSRSEKSGPLTKGFGRRSSQVFSNNVGLKRRDSTCSVMSTADARGSIISSV